MTRLEASRHASDGSKHILPRAPTTPCQPPVGYAIHAPPPVPPGSPKEKQLPPCSKQAQHTAWHVLHKNVTCVRYHLPTVPTGVATFNPSRHFGSSSVDSMEGLALKTATSLGRSARRRRPLRGGLRRAVWCNSTPAMAGRAPAEGGRWDFPHYIHPCDGGAARRSGGGGTCRRDRRWAGVTGRGGRCGHPGRPGQRGAPQTPRRPAHARAAPRPSASAGCASLARRHPLCLRGNRTRPPTVNATTLVRLKHSSKVRPPTFCKRRRQAAGTARPSTKRAIHPPSRVTSRRSVMVGNRQARGARKGQQLDRKWPLGGGRGGKSGGRRGGSGKQMLVRAAPRRRGSRRGGP